MLSNEKIELAFFLYGAELERRELIEQGTETLKDSLQKGASRAGKILGYWVLFTVVFLTVFLHQFLAGFKVTSMIAPAVGSLILLYLAYYPAHVETAIDFLGGLKEIYFLHKSTAHLRMGHRLYGIKLFRNAFKSEDRKHLHWHNCIFCYSLFDPKKSNALRYGYCPEHREFWICQQCRLEFDKKLRWRVFDIDGQPERVEESIIGFPGKPVER